ncbi:hypothetical protein PSY31_23610, partial [Shigella flexneri]|nr:hypothetical protein [Shigella flexneri]
VEETESEPKEELPNEHETADEDGQAVEGQEPAETVSQVPASSENGKTEIESTDKLEQPGAEVEEPSKELSQEGNIPMTSAEG